MTPRVSELIHTLKLEPYAEGGHYCEVYRSSQQVYLPVSQEKRCAMTTIYYLLAAGEFDSWHRVKGDEIWHFHEGDPLELIWVEGGKTECIRHTVGEVGEVSRPFAVVPGGCWQMARTLGEYTFVSCTVGPGFEFEDYKLLRDNPEKASEIRRRFPDLAEFM